MANLIERLLELGLGTVVTERDQASNGSGSRLDSAVATVPVGSESTESLSPTASLTPRSVTAANCPKRGTTHNPGTKCNECGTSFPAREFKPDPKVKP